MTDVAVVSTVEQRRLGTVRPETLQLLLALKAAAREQLGFTLEIPDFGGIRDSTTQAALYADSLRQGGGVLAYPVGKPGTSRHEYGAAFDVHIMAGGSADDGTGTDDDYSALADLARALPQLPGLDPGWDFTNRDQYHFQLRETLLDSQMRWKAMRRAGIVAPLLAGLLAVGLFAARR